MRHKVNRHQLHIDTAVVHQVADIHREIYSNLLTDKHTDIYRHRQTQISGVRNCTLGNWRLVIPISSNSAYVSFYRLDPQAEL